MNTLTYPYPVTPLACAPRKGSKIGIVWYIRLASGEYMRPSYGGSNFCPRVGAKKEAWLYCATPADSALLMSSIEAWASQVDGEIHGEEYEWMSGWI